MDIFKVVQIIKKHLLPFSIFCISATISAVLITYAISEKYEASSLVLVRPQKDITFPGLQKRKNVVAFPLGTNIPLEATNKTFEELITSWTIAQKISERLDLKDGPLPTGDSLKEQWKRLKSEIKAQLIQLWDLVRFGRVIEIDSQIDNISEIQKSLSMNPTKDSYVFEISSLWKTPEGAADIVNAASAEFVNLLVDITTSEASHTRKLLEKQLHNTAALLRSYRTQLKEFKEENKSVSFSAELKEKIKVISKMESDREELNAKLAGLLKKFSPENPKVLEMTGESNQLAMNIRQRRKELERMPFKESKLANLELLVEVTETTYKVLNKEYEQSRIQEIKRSNLDIRIITPAFAPERPVKPIKILYAAAAFFMAFLLGILIILFSESVDETMDNIKEIENTLELPVIATLPVRRFF